MICPARTNQTPCNQMSVRADTGCTASANAFFDLAIRWLNPGSIRDPGSAPYRSALRYLRCSATTSRMAAFASRQKYGMLT